MTTPKKKTSSERVRAYRRRAAREGWAQVNVYVHRDDTQHIKNLARVLNEAREKK